MTHIQKIKTGLLSYGMSGRVFHAPFLEESDFFDLCAVVERRHKNAASRYSAIVSYDSVDALLGDPDIELVVVNTPNNTHFDFAKRALLAGKHVLVEKPFAPTVDQAQELYAIARSVNRHVLPYQNRRFDSDFLSLKYILEKRFVGKPIELHLRFDRFKPEIGAKLFKERRIPGAGILYDLGSHLVDQAIALFGQPKSVTKIKSSNRKKSVVDDYASIFINFHPGIHVFITVSLQVLAPQYSIVLHGTNGSFVKKRTDVQEAQLLEGMLPSDAAYGLEGDHSAGMLTLLDETDTLEEIPVYADRGNYMTVFDSVYQTIRHNQLYYVTEEQLIWQISILEPAKS